MNVSSVNTDPAVSSEALQPSRLKQLRQSVNQVVATTFYDTLMKMARSESFKGQYGHGGRGEEVFAHNLDQVLIERVSQSGRFHLADAIYDRLQKHCVDRPEIAGHEAIQDVKGQG